MVANDATTPVRRSNSGHARTVDLVRICYCQAVCVVLLYCGTTKGLLTHFCFVVYFTIMLNDVMYCYQLILNH